jgi:hypothetical protein
MTLMRPIYAVACSLVFSLFACATGTTGGGGGSGGEDDWGGPSGPASSSATGGGGGTGGGSPVTYCDINNIDCTTCVNCSRSSADGQCNGVYQDCLNNIECTDFITCLNGCPPDDATCEANCEAVYPTGTQLFNFYASCVICNDCYVLCEGAKSCTN